MSYAFVSVGHLIFYVFCRGGGLLSPNTTLILTPSPLKRAGVRSKNKSPTPPKAVGQIFLASSLFS